MLKSLACSVLVLLLLSACSNSKRTFSSSYEKRSNQVKDSNMASFDWQVEHQTVKEVARQEILNTPLEFDIEFADNAAAWDRAILFFQNELKSLTESFKSDRILASNHKDTASKYIFVVSKRPALNGNTYRVTCADRKAGKTDIAELNARNLARFIIHGELERSLLILN